MRPILAGSLASHTRPGEKRKENSVFSTFIIQNIASIKVIEARYSIQSRNMGPDIQCVIINKSDEILASWW